MAHRAWVCLLLLNLACGQDDAGADLDMESMMGDTGGGGAEQVGGKAAVVLTQIEQTTRALQQLGIILSRLRRQGDRVQIIFVTGVAFLVSFLFMVMMAVEKTWEQLMKSYENCEGKGQGQEEDPAALVGTFKRYK